MGPNPVTFTAAARQNRNCLIHVFVCSSIRIPIRIRIRIRMHVRQLQLQLRQVPRERRHELCKECAAVRGPC